MSVLRYPSVVERARPLTFDPPRGSDWQPSDNAYRGEDDEDYEVLRDAVIAAFNPPDEDAAEVSLMTDAIDRAWGFIVAQPCSCTPIGTDDVEVCWRCDVLGRMADRTVER